MVTNNAAKRALNKLVRWKKLIRLHEVRADASTREHSFLTGSRLTEQTPSTTAMGQGDHHVQRCHPVLSQLCRGSSDLAWFCAVSCPP